MRKWWTHEARRLPQGRAPLTDAEIDAEVHPLGMAPHSVLVGPDEIRRFARAIERAHGIGTDAARAQAQKG